MSAVVRSFRRAPGRLLAGVLAIALATGAVGVLAIPTVSGQSLHAAAERDGLGDIVVSTTALDAEQVARIAALPGVRDASGSAVVAATIAVTDTPVRLVGLPAPRSLDLLHLTAGRAATGAGEVVAPAGLAAVGDLLDIAGRRYEVVGNGSTFSSSGTDTLYADLADVVTITPGRGVNRLTIAATDDARPSLERIVDEVRAALAEQGDTFTAIPELLPDGSTPIDADIRQVSTLIGLLGVVAGLVALVLLASTTATLITERTREIAVMRALGGRRRALRRRLRRVALGITVAGLVIGLPLGVLISNVIARMVLERFVGITPAVAVDVRVLIGSAAGALLGARMVSARAARRVTNLPLAEVLRDREAAPFGRGRFQRLAARVPTGGLDSRLATRALLRRPGRTVAVVAQIAAAVGAAFLVPSLALSVNPYNAAAFEPWQWQLRATARDAGLPIDATAVRGEGEEPAVFVSGAIDGRDLDVWGLPAGTAMFDAPVSAGRWFAPGRREVVLSRGFAARRGVEVGDTVDLALAAGTVRYTVAGTVDDHWLAVYADREVLATDLGSPGGANVVLVRDGDAAPAVPVAVDLTTRAAARDDSAAGRDAIVAIFGAIGAIVAGVAALAVLSSMLVGLYERRHEIAAMRALGAGRGRLRRLLARELLVLGVIGASLGFVLGALGTRGIIASFESSNAVEIGVVDAVRAVPAIAGGLAVALVLLAVVAVRGAVRRPIAVTLRGAA